MTASEQPEKRRGRRRIVPDGNWVLITCKAPIELREEFNALGGSDWLRDLLAASLRGREKDRLKKPPTG